MNTISLRLVASILGLMALLVASQTVTIDKIRVAHNFKALNEDFKGVILDLRDVFVFVNYDCSRSYASRKKCDKAFDVATLSNPDVFETYKHWVEHSKKPMSIAFPDEPKSILLFDNKFVWKLWMQRIGLQNYLPSTLDIHNMTFPCVMKVLSSRGDTDNIVGYNARGVFLLNSKAEYERHAEEVRVMGSNFFVEEAITSPDLREGVMVGSFYHSHPLSLRCIEYSFTPAAFAQAASAGSATTQKTNAFVFHNSPAERGNATVMRISCGHEVARSVWSMFREAHYHGVFCIDFKRDRAGNIKFLEVNPRFCNVLAVSSSLFQSVYMPLAFAIEQRRQERLELNFEEAEEIKSWYSNEQFRSVVIEEKKVALSGIDPLHGTRLILR